VCVCVRVRVCVCVCVCHIVTEVWRYARLICDLVEVGDSITGLFGLTEVSRHKVLLGERVQIECLRRRPVLQKAPGFFVARRAKGGGLDITT